MKFGGNAPPPGSGVEGDAYLRGGKWKGVVGKRGDETMICLAKQRRFARPVHFLLVVKNMPGMDTNTAPPLRNKIKTRASSVNI